MPAPRTAVALTLAAALGWLAALDRPAAAQPAKKPVIAAEPVTLRPGEPLSNRTLVLRPPAASGATSWTIETRRHRGPVNTAALSPDGKQVATGGQDGVIRVWNAETGEFVRALVGHNGYVYGLAWSPSGAHLASTGSFDNTAKVWEAGTGLLVRTLAKGHKGYTHHVAWTPDGKGLFVAGGSSGYICLWDLTSTKAEPTKPVETGSEISSLVAGPDGKQAAAAGAKFGVHVWDVQDRKNLHALEVPGQAASGLAWSPDGTKLVGGGKNKSVVWDAATGKKEKELDAGGVAIAFSKAGDKLAVSIGTKVGVWAGGFDGMPKVIDMAADRSLHFTPDGGHLCGATASAVSVFSAESGEAARRIDVGGSDALLFAPGRPLVTGLRDKTPELWDTATGKKVAALEGHTSAVTSAAWSRDGKLLATASHDKTVRVWDAAGKPVQTFSGHAAAVRCVAWGEGKWLASGSDDKTVRVWQAGTDKGKMAGKHLGAVTAVAWSKDGKTLASGGEEHDVYLAQPETDKAPQQLQASAPVRSVAWAGTGKAVAVGGAKGDVQLFAPAGGKVLQTFPGGGSPPDVTALAFSPDGTLLLGGRANFTAQVWRPGTTAAPVMLAGMSAPTAVAWTAGGTSAAVSEDDRQVRVFDLPGGALRASLVSDGKQVAAVSAGGHYRAADEAASELVYVVQTKAGQETLSPKDFADKFKFKNNPAAVVLTGK